MKTMLDVLTAAGESKAVKIENTPKYITASMLAGIYIGVAMFLIFTIGGLLAVSGITHYKILMGVSFGIGLSLVIMLEAELFTGNVMITTAVALNRNISLKTAFLICFWSYLGNLIGSVFIGALFYFAETTSGGVTQFFVDASNAKLNCSNSALFFKGVLCNMLVCMAVLSALRLKEETAKLIMIFWCLFAFITTGFEHCIANMSILTAAWFMGHGQVLMAGIINNLVWVTLGNAAGGAILAAAYYIINKK